MPETLSDKTTIEKRFDYFLSDGGLVAEEVVLKGEKKFFVEGFISTTDADLQNDVITDFGQDDLLRQLNERNITFDDDSHESWYDPETKQQLDKPRNTLPIMRVVKAERVVGDKNGVKVKAEMNTDHPRFTEVWNSIKKGFLHAFSVAFYPVEAVTRTVKGVSQRFINKLNLINITPTGWPINPSATFVPVMKSALLKIEDTPKMEVATMPEEAKEVIMPDLKAEHEKAVTELNEKHVAELKAATEKFDAEKAASEKLHAEIKSGLDKSIEKIASLENEVADLKAKLKEPLLKANAPSPAPASQEVKVGPGPMDLIR